MSDRCAGCTNKYGYFEHPRLCPECKRSFCQTCLPNVTPDSKKKRKKSNNKMPLVSIEPCVYCQRQKKISKSEEAEIMENFQERFYKHTHTEPPIQSKLHQDLSKGLPAGETGMPLRLTDEDRALEERLKKLKATGKATKPSYTESEMRDKLSALKGEDGQGASDVAPVTGPTRTTQVEQARDLIEKATDEVRMDQKVDEMKSQIDDQLHQRFQALKGTKDTTSSETTKATKPDINITEFLEGIELEVPDEDPEKLLNDLKTMQHKEERGALAEAGRGDVQALIQTARELAKEEGEAEGGAGADSGGENLVAKLKNISYPDLDQAEDDKEKLEVSKLFDDTIKEIEQDKEQEKEDGKYLEGANQRLTKLRGDTEDVVRSKLDHPQGLDIAWRHFGQPSSVKPGVLSAAKELGLEASTDSQQDDEDAPEVQALINKLVAEAELESKLEASGSKVTKPNPPKESKASGSKVTKPDPPKESKASDSKVTKPDPPQESKGAARFWPSSSGENDDFPWCCICNEDATLRCYDCDDDLYCTRCFSEGHEQFGLFDHRYAPFEQRKQQQ